MITFQSFAFFLFFCQRFLIGFGYVCYRNGTWKWSDGKAAAGKLTDIVKNYNDTEALSMEPLIFCCVVTHDPFLECINCSEQHAFLCEDFQGETC